MDFNLPKHRFWIIYRQWK